MRGGEEEEEEKRDFCNLRGRFLSCFDQPMVPLPECHNAHLLPSPISALLASSPNTRVSGRLGRNYSRWHDRPPYPPSGTPPVTMVTSSVALPNPLW